MPLQIATILGIIAQLISDLVGGKVGAITSAAIAIVKAANDMHIAQEGKPIDPSLLLPEAPVS